MKHVPLLLFGIFAAFWSFWDLRLGVWGATAPSILLAGLLIWRRKEPGQ